MLDRLKAIEARYNEINQLLIDPEVVSNVKKLTELSKEQKSLEKIVVLFKEQQKLENSLDDLKEMKKSDDAEIAEMAAMELDESKARLEQIAEELKLLLLPKDPNDDKDVIVEIKGAVGGDEANIFAGDLFSSSCNSLHNLSLVKIRSFEFSHNMSVAHYNQTTAGTKHLLNFRRNEGNAYAIFRKFKNQFLNLELGSYIDTSCRLVENQIIRMGEKPSGQNYFLLVSTAQ